jgi:hypothetical protein
LTLKAKEETVPTQWKRVGIAGEQVVYEATADELPIGHGARIARSALASFLTVRKYGKD